MSNKINQKTISKIIANHLNVKSSEITAESRAKDFKNWDSLNNIKIFLSIQKIKKNLKISDYTKCKKVGEIFKILS